MKILFLGDSITAGAGLNKKEETFASLVGKSANAEVVNYGVGGTRIARNSEPSKDASYDDDFLQRAENMDKNADFIFVFGGTNDYGHGDAPIGDISDETPYTFCGAVNILSEYLVKNYGVNYLDMRSDFPPEKLDELTIDGIHPNAKGHKIIAERICGYLKNAESRNVADGKSE